MIVNFHRFSSSLTISIALHISIASLAASIAESLRPSSPLPSPPSSSSLPSSSLPSSTFLFLEQVLHLGHLQLDFAFPSSQSPFSLVSPSHLSLLLAIRVSFAELIAFSFLRCRFSEPNVLLRVESMLAAARVSHCDRFWSSSFCLVLVPPPQLLPVIFSRISICGTDYLKSSSQPLVLIDRLPQSLSSAL